MIDHIGINVSSLSRSLSFYKSALAPLGYSIIAQGDAYAGLGTEQGTDLWLKESPEPSPAFHLAFSAKNREQVNAFYTSAMASDGRDNGTPGLRPHYHQHYYGAFVFDPDGNNIEAVCHKPESELKG